MALNKRQQQRLQLCNRHVRIYCTKYACWRACRSTYNTFFSKILFLFTLRDASKCAVISTSLCCLVAVCSHARHRTFQMSKRKRNSLRFFFRCVFDIFIFNLRTDAADSVLIRTCDRKIVKTSSIRIMQIFKMKKRERERQKTSRVTRNILRTEKYHSSIVSG